MGSLDQPQGASVKRKIKIIDLTGMTAVQIESDYNTNYGQKGWRIVQVFAIGNKNYIMAEREE